MWYYSLSEEGGENTLSNRIKELRTERKITLEKIAQSLQVTPMTIQRYETGKREPKLETWEKLAKFFGVSVAYLIGESNIKEPYNKWSKADFLYSEYLRSSVKLEEEYEAYLSEFSDKIKDINTNESPEDDENTLNHRIGKTFNLLFQAEKDLLEYKQKHIELEIKQSEKLARYQDHTKE